MPVVKGALRGMPVVMGGVRAPEGYACGYGGCESVSV